MFELDALERMKLEEIELKELGDKFKQHIKLKKDFKLELHNLGFIIKDESNKVLYHSTYWVKTLYYGTKGFYFRSSELQTPRSFRKEMEKYFDGIRYLIENIDKLIDRLYLDSNCCKNLEFGMVNIKRILEFLFLDLTDDLQYEKYHDSDQILVDEYYDIDEFEQTLKEQNIKIEDVFNY